MSTHTRRFGLRLSRLACLSAIPLLLGPFMAAADVLELKTGGSLQGSYAGGTADTIRFETAEGIKVVSRTDVLALKFISAPAPAAPPPATTQKTTGTPKEITIPGGSLLVVQMKTQVTSNDKAGKGFEAVLMGDLESGGGVVAKAGTPVVGRIDDSKKAGRLAGKAKLQISLTQLNINGKLVPVVTSNYAEAGEGSFKKTARNAGVGALVGGAVSDNGGEKGAAVGVAVSLIKKGDSVTIPPGAVLEFRLTQPVKLNTAP